MRHRIILAILGAGALVAALVAAPASWAVWSCSDGSCHAVAHVQDDGVDGPIPVLCGTNLIRYDIAEYQSSQALGCNDVNRIGAKPGHKTTCEINGDWIVVVTRDDSYSTVGWSSGYLGIPNSGDTYGCVDGAFDLNGGGGGGGGGGGSW